MGIYLAGCPAPFVVSPSGTCVNTQNDFDNCGTVGYVCPSNYTRCAGGRCKVVPTVQLVNPTVIATGANDGNLDDNVYVVNLPFNIVLYQTTIDRVTLSTNGVSFSFTQVLFHFSQ